MINCCIYDYRLIEYFVYVFNVLCSFYRCFRYPVINKYRIKNNSDRGTLAFTE